MPPKSRTVGKRELIDLGVIITEVDALGNRRLVLRHDRRPSMVAPPTHWEFTWPPNPPPPGAPPPPPPPPPAAAPFPFANLPPELRLQIMGHLDLSGNCYRNGLAILNLAIVAPLLFLLRGRNIFQEEAQAILADQARDVNVVPAALDFAIRDNTVPLWIIRRIIAAYAAVVPTSLDGRWSNTPIPVWAQNRVVMPPIFIAATNRQNPALGGPVVLALVAAGAQGDIEWRDLWGLFDAIGEVIRSGTQPMAQFLAERGFNKIEPRLGIQRGFEGLIARGGGTLRGLSEGDGAGGFITELVRLGANVDFRGPAHRTNQNLFNEMVDNQRFDNARALLDAQVQRGLEVAKHTLTNYDIHGIRANNALLTQVATAMATLGQEDWRTNLLRSTFRHADETARVLIRQNVGVNQVNLRHAIRHASNETVTLFIITSQARGEAIDERISRSIYTGTRQRPPRAFFETPMEYALHVRNYGAVALLSGAGAVYRMSANTRARVFALRTRYLDPTVPVAERDPRRYFHRSEFPPGRNLRLAQRRVLASIEAALRAGVVEPDPRTSPEPPDPLADSEESGWETSDPE
ncbi:Uu.00g073930.m01.CDS01 [Anthostomella pinea]|uniref:Uu.00g073930.m01.CDS01 n=1 Tax=Anthostomella pinea TaxID=933095 RepID=A0AAI8VVF5_9PEZI|nr:Uu.00g073930.m01.CDS01 [Anthostomella pinea]